MNRFGLVVLFAVAILSVRVQAAKSEQRVGLSDCPKVVQKTLKRESHGGRVAEIEKENHAGRLVYEADVWINEKEYEVQIAVDGMLVSKLLEGEKGKENDEDEDDRIETEVNQAELPRAVRRTLRRESRGGEVEEIEKKQQDGKTVYEAEIEIGDWDYEVEIAEDGTLFSKVVEHDEDEDDEDDEDDECDEDDEDEEDEDDEDDEDDG